MPGSQPNHKIRFFIETGMAVAISAMFVLFLGVFRIPASIPIFFISYRRGPRVAMAAAVAVGMMVLLVKPLYLHPVVFIEAPLEYLMMPWQGIFPRGDRTFENKITGWLYDRRGILISSLLRLGVTLIGSYIIYSYFFQLTGPVIWTITLLDEIPLFIPFLIVAMVLVPMLVRYDYVVHELK